MVLLPSTPFDVQPASPSRGLPSGCKAFGNRASPAEVESWLKPWRDSGRDISLLLVLAGTRTAEVEGISAAGSTSASRRYTAVADAELLLKGVNRPRLWPLPPLPAGISPALISYVAARWIGVDPLVAAVGLTLPPPFPHLRLEAARLGPSACLSTGEAMDYSRVQALWQRGLCIGRGLRRPLVLAECVPGGTTTAQAVLTGLGLQVADLISGSALRPPMALKQELVDRGLHQAALGINPPPERLLAAFGDPFQPMAVGLLIGAREAGQPVLLGGGSQMVAVLALALAAIEPAHRQDLADGIALGTTAWLAEEVNRSDGRPSALASLVDCVGEYFGVRLLGLATGLRFHSSKHQALQDYELGHVKEGVGAGALALLAQLQGASCQQLVEDCDQAVNQLLEVSCSEDSFCPVGSNS